jgi:hypothetical protein
MKIPALTRYDQKQLDEAALEAVNGLHTRFPKLAHEKIAYALCCAAIRGMELDNSAIRDIATGLLAHFGLNRPPAHDAPVSGWPDNASPEDIEAMRAVLNLWVGTIHATAEALSPTAPADMVERFMGFGKLPKQVQGPILADMMMTLLVHVGKLVPAGTDTHH